MLAAALAPAGVAARPSPYPGSEYSSSESDDNKIAPTELAVQKSDSREEEG